MFSIIALKHYFLPFRIIGSSWTEPDVIPTTCDSWFLLPQVFWSVVFARHSGFMTRGNHKYIYIYIYGGGPKMMVPNNHWFSGFPTKNDHFGVFWGYHHFSWETSTKYKPKFCFMLILKNLSPKKTGKHQLFFEKCPAFQMLQIQLVHCTNIAEMKYGNLVVFTSRIQRVVKRLKDVFRCWWCLNLHEHVTIKLVIDSCWYVSILCGVWSTSRIQFPQSVEMIRLAVPSTWMSQEVSKWVISYL